MAQIPFVSESYNLDSRPASVQRVINMMPVPIEPGNERTDWVFKDVPGLAVASAAPDIAWLAPSALVSGNSAISGTTGSVAFTSPPATLTIYAGVVGYTSDAVVWTLNTTLWSQGTAPTLAAGPAGKTGVVFTADSGGQFHLGTALLTATVDGVAASATLRAIVAAGDCEGQTLTWNET